MKTYRIYFSTAIEVKAENEDEAIEKAAEEISTADLMVTDVDELHNKP